jgi:putative transposase
MQSDPKIFYRRRLPHYQPPNETFHVTFRLAGSMPQETILRLKREHEEINKRIEEVKSTDEQRRFRRELGVSYFTRFDEFLDRAIDGPFWLREDAVAARVAEIIHAQDGKDYDLLAYCLMPNHVHLLATFWQPTINAAEVQVERSSDRYGLTTRKTSKFAIQAVGRNSFRLKGPTKFERTEAFRTRLDRAGLSWLMNVILAFSSLSSPLPFHYIHHMIKL